MRAQLDIIRLYCFHKKDEGYALRKRVFWNDYDGCRH